MKDDNLSKEIDEIVALLDGYVAAEGSRMNIKVAESGNAEAGWIGRQYHHGRCDVGSPWAKGQAFDV